MSYFTDVWRKNNLGGVKKCKMRFYEERTCSGTVPWFEFVTREIKKGTMTNIQLVSDDFVWKI
jgi:hypothetical protein